MNDFCGAGIGASDKWTPKRWVEGNIEYYDDEWGNLWHRRNDMGVGGEVLEPAIKDWSMLKDYQLPDMANPKRFEAAREVFSKESEKYRMGSLPEFPFAVCRYLRTMEQYFQDLLLERDNIDELHDKVSTLLEKVIEQWADAGADGVFFYEDWGTQHRLLVHPKMWREIFKPIYQRLCGKIHSLGMDVLMHSCGRNWDILDDLAEVGVNAFQFDQPDLYGLEDLAERLRGLKVCLFSGCDIQKILPTGDKELIVSETRKMVELFGGKDGGLIAKNYGDLPGIGVEKQWDQWAYEAFVETQGLTVDSPL